MHDDYLDELNLIVIELPKWKKLNIFDLEKPQDRWLMYLSDPNMFSKFLTEKELARYNEISEAIEVLETKNFTPEQIRGYELYIDNMRSYVTNMSEARREGIEEGRNQIMENTFAILNELKYNTLSVEQIAEKFNVSIQYVQQLKKSIS